MTMTHYPDGSPALIRAPHPIYNPPTAKLTALGSINTGELRAAAAAWRHADVIATQHRRASGWFKWLTPEPNYTLHDKIDDLVAEIDRLRVERLPR